MEKLEFDTWHSMAACFHGAPLGVQQACMAAWPALFGGGSLPCLPGDVVGIIMQWVVALSFNAYAQGATGVRARCIKFGGLSPLSLGLGVMVRNEHGLGNPGGVDLKVAFMACEHCSLHMGHAWF